jgi:hypothetical protein
MIYIGANNSDSIYGFNVQTNEYTDFSNLVLGSGYKNIIAYEGKCIVFNSGSTYQINEG